MLKQVLEIIQLSWTWMFNGLYENYYILVLLACLTVQTQFGQEWLEFASLILSKSRLVHSNVISSSLLTRAFLKRQKVNLAFFLWSCSMLLEYNYLEFAPFGTFRIASVTVPWASVLLLTFVVYGCMKAARSTLVPGQRRITTDAALSSTWETRDLKEIILVSSPVNGTVWLSRFIRKCQKIAAEYRQKIITNYSILQRLESSHQLGEVVLNLSISVIASLSVVVLSFLWFRDPNMNLFGLPLSMISALVATWMEL